jgi:WD40 repeat protein
MYAAQELLASCSYDDTIKLWGGDGDDWSCLNTLKAHSGTVWQCSFDPTGSALASCSDDFSVRIWTRARGAAKHNYVPPPPPLPSPSPPHVDLQRALE